MTAKLKTKDLTPDINDIVSVETSSLSTFQPALTSISDPDGDFNMVTMLTDMTEDTGSEMGVISFASVAADGALTLNLDGTLIGAMSPSGDALVLTLTENGSTEAARDVMIAVKRP